MSHEITWTQEKGWMFYTTGDPGWHNLGTVQKGVHRSAQAAGKEMGLFTEEKIPLFMQAGKKFVKSGWYNVVRTGLGSEPRVMGDPVRESWELITSADACRLRDEAVEHMGEIATIDTMGYLRNGENLFICTRLPDTNIGGDEMRNYLVLIIPFTHGNAYQAIVTPVRVVCMNTEMAAIAAATSMMKVSHAPGAGDVLRDWMKDAYEGAKFAQDAVTQAMEILTKKTVTTPEIKWVINNTYELPTRPGERREDGSFSKGEMAARKPMAERISKWEADCAQIEKTRTDVFNLATGAMAGYDTPAAYGTAWGLWNAVTQYENHGRNVRKVDGYTFDLFTGSRMSTMRRAHALSFMVDRKDEFASGDDAVKAYNKVYMRTREKVRVR